MKPLLTIFAFLPGAFMSSAAMADHGHRDSLQSCLMAASAIKEGYFAKVEYLTLAQRGADVYEIEIHDRNNVEWELICNSETGKITEIEREVGSPDDPLFRKQMKVDRDTAAKTALELYPGKLVHTEYEIESNGEASYEFDIYDHPGTTYKVEVDASSGEIVEMSIEKWDIGRETDEE